MRVLSFAVFSSSLFSRPADGIGLLYDVEQQLQRSSPSPDARRVLTSLEADVGGEGDDFVPRNMNTTGRFVVEANAEVTDLLQLVQHQEDEQGQLQDQQQQQDQLHDLLQLQDQQEQEEHNLLAHKKLLIHQALAPILSGKGVVSEATLAPLADFDASVFEGLEAEHVSALEGAFRNLGKR